MNSSLDEDLVQRVNDLGSTSWTGTTFRHISGRRDPLSGAGARMFGGRWNPKGSFNALYLAQPGAACMAELDRLAESQNLSIKDLIRAGRTVHTIEVHDLPILDLRSAAARTAVGLELTDLNDGDWTACQAVGHAAHFLNFGGLVAPSASGIGIVVTAFEARLRPGQLELIQSQPLTRANYDQMRAA